MMNLDVLHSTELPEAKRFCSEGKISSQDNGAIDQLSAKNVDAKKTRQNQKNLLNSMPRFKLREHGENASISVADDARLPLFVMDIQHLVMFSQMGNKTIYSPARWCQIERVGKLQQTNVLIIENMSLYNYISNESCFPYLSTQFKHKLEVIPSSMHGTDFIQEFLFVPLNNAQIKKYTAVHGDLKLASEKEPDVLSGITNIFPVHKISEKLEGSENDSDVFPRTSLLLSGWQMIEENFPLPIKGMWHRKYKGYVLTKDRYDEVKANSPMFAVDCEMCRTSIGDLELTRVSIVDENYKSIYEELVKPDNKIVDYLTRFSGITEKLIKKATKTLRDVQEDIRNLLPADAIIVGQSLSSDFHALKIMHPYVIDTSIIFNLSGQRSRKSKLKDLMRYFLNERIQDSKNGHCSLEDSLACLKLVKLKLSKSIDFGDAVMSSAHTSFNPQLGHSNYGISLLKHLAKKEEKKHLMVISTPDCAHRYSYYTFKSPKIKRSPSIVIQAEENNDAVIDRMSAYAKTHSLRIAHCKLSEAELNNNIYAKVDEWVRKVEEHSELPCFTVVLFAADVGCSFINVKV